MLRFWPGDDYTEEMDEKAVGKIDGWVSWALSRNIKVLHLSQSGTDDEIYFNYGPPNCIWNNTTLVELWLSSMISERELEPPLTWLLWKPWCSSTVMLKMRLSIPWFLVSLCFRVWASLIAILLMIWVSSLPIESDWYQWWRRKLYNQLPVSEVVWLWGGSWSPQTVGFVIPCEGLTLHWVCSSVFLWTYLFASEISTFLGKNPTMSWTHHCLRILLGQSHRNVTIIGYGKGTSAFVLRFVEVLIRNAFVLDKLVIKKETETPGKDMLTYEELYNFTRKLLAIPRAATHAKVRIGVDLVLRDAHGCCFWCNHRTC